MNTPNKLNRRTGGFAMIQVAFLVAVVALTVGSVFAFWQPMQTAKQEHNTIIKQEKIATALSTFAQRFGYLPCPSDPNNPSLDVIGRGRTTCNTAATRVGVVPFMVLSLSPDDIIDSFGNPFTYAVQTSVADASNTDMVYNRCRMATGPAPWINGANLNAAKARFCCRGVAANAALPIFSNAARTAVTAAQNAGGDVLENVNNPAASASTTSSLTYNAYVLVSHGKNGAGAYLIGASTRKALLNAGTMEIANTTTNPDTGYFAAMQNLTTGLDYFDDIVLWRSQERTISELGNDTCARP